MIAFERQVAVSGVVVGAFAAAFAVALAVSPPTALQLSHADPLVQLAAASLGLHAIPVVACLAAVVWLLAFPPDGENLRRGGLLACAAIAAIAMGLPALRVVIGPVLPAFVPPEESAQPGMALGIAAALLEEGVFRLGILAVVYTVLSRKKLPAGAASVLITALILAAAHEVGPGAAVFDLAHFITRFAVLGVIMGTVFVRIGPAFLVAAHCAAHVAIPLLFPGGQG